MPKIKIHTSILEADFGDLNHYLQKLESFSDTFHVDVMDGNFVENLTFGAPVVKCIKTARPIECHLMIMNPRKYIGDFLKAGADTIIIHAEADKSLKKSVEFIKSFGCKTGVSVNPSTPVGKIEKVLGLVDLVLAMSVVPGFGGQAFMPEILPKISWIRSRCPELDIAVDGGIDDKTGVWARAAGANVFVAGSYILKAADPKKAAEKLRAAVQ